MNLPLFDPETRARKSDPETSHEAARQAAKFVGGDQQKILNYLDEIHPHAAHYRLIAANTGLDRHAVGRRLKEIEAVGLIERAGTTRMDNGRSGTMWRIKS